MSSLLMREFLSWISSRPRTYEEAMEAWRSTCPRHSVWEDALLEGLIQMESRSVTNVSEVTLTPKGRAVLDGNGNWRMASQIIETLDDEEAWARSFREQPALLRSLAGEALEEHRRGETRPLDELIG